MKFNENQELYIMSLICWLYRSSIKSTTINNIILMNIYKKMSYNKSVYYMYQIFL